MQLKVHWFISLIKSNSLKHFTLIYNHEKDPYAYVGDIKSSS